MSDVVSGLLAKLDELERLAQAAQGRQWDDDYDELRPVESVWQVDNDGNVYEQATGDTIAACTRDDWEHTALRAGVAPYIAANGPQAFLRLCRAHRDLIERVSSIWHQVVEDDCWFTCAAATEEREGDTTCREDAGTDCDCGRDQLVAALLGDLARGLGVEETSDGN